MRLDPDTLVRPSSRAVFRELVDGKGVLLNLDTGGYHGLNRTGSLIWTLLDDGTVFADLVDALRRHVDGATPSLEQDVAEFLEGLSERNLVVLTPGPRGAASEDREGVGRS